MRKGAQLSFSGYRLDGSSGMRRGNGEQVAGRFFQQSSWATHTVALASQLARVPDGLDLDLAGPYGCSISTGAGTILNELRPPPGATIAIFGVGNVGLAAVMAARLSAAVMIIAIDKVPQRLALARELGATHSLEHGSETVAELKSLMELQRQGRFPLEKLVRFYDFAEIDRAIDDSEPSPSTAWVAALVTRASRRNQRN